MDGHFTNQDASHSPTFASHCYGHAERINAASIGSFVACTNITTLEKEAAYANIGAQLVHQSISRTDGSTSSEWKGSNERRPLHIKLVFELSLSVLITFAKVEHLYGILTCPFREFDKRE